MTNEEKFKEVFGFVPSDNIKRSVCPEDFNCVHIQCYDCPFYWHWWKREYKSCFELEEINHNRGEKV